MSLHCKNYCIHLHIPPPLRHSRSSRHPSPKNPCMHAYTHRPWLVTSSPQVTDVCMLRMTVMNIEKLEGSIYHSSFYCLPILPSSPLHKFQSQPHPFLLDGNHWPFWHSSVIKQEWFSNCHMNSLGCGSCKCENKNWQVSQCDVPFKWHQLGW